jgi:fatty acid desaturase
MTNDDKRIVTYGVKLGTLKRKKSAVWRFIWEFLLVAIVVIGIPLALLMVIVHDNKHGFPQYNRELRANPHDN